jgi:hypothetical protein
MTDIMIDLETLSTKNNAIILTIGAIKFNRNNDWGEDFTIESIHESKKFYKRITIESCEKLGLDRDANTEKWWNEQDKDAKEEAFGFVKDRYDIIEVLKMFSKWFGNSRYVWGNGSSFDITILTEAYSRCGLELPWKFYNIRDLRTLLDLYNVRLSNFTNNSKHNALYDCFYQIKALKSCF